MTNNLQLIYLEKIVPLEFCYFYTNVLMRQGDIAPKTDSQFSVPRGMLNHEYMFETLHERLWPVIEEKVGEELIPTYAYSRLYINGDVLKKHSDRPACEVSVTIQLGRSHHYSWPIYMGGQKFDLGEGDGVIYPGYDVEHWRNECNGPDGYYSGQVFLHFVRKNGPYTDEVGDNKNRRGAYSYMKNRTALMEEK